MSANGHPLVQRVAQAAEGLPPAFFERFELCPLLGTEQDLKVFRVMLSDKVPVVISDALELPYADEVCYERTLFLLGSAPSSLQLLWSISEMPEVERRMMVEAGRAVVQCIFPPEEEWLRPSLVGPAFPAKLSDGRLLRECERFRCMWRTLSGRILMFGGGKYAKRLLEAVEGLEGGPQLMGIADDRMTERSELFGVPLDAGNGFEVTSFDAVFLATDALEERFAARVQELYGENISLLKPSELMAPERMIWAGDDAERLPVLEAPVQGDFLTKLEGVTVCVGYADFLSWSLPQNLPLFDRFVVVTSSQDVATQEVARKCGAELVISDRYGENGARFNKGKMLNDGLAALDRDGWVLVTDADILLDGGFRRRVSCRYLNTHSLYYATRFNTPAQEREAWLEQWFEEPKRLNECPFDDPGANQMPWGYFQLFYGPGAPSYPEPFESAGEVDYAFQALWPVEQRVLLAEAVVHIAHGALGQNWQGRASAMLRMRH